MSAALKIQKLQSVAVEEYAELMREFMDLAQTKIPAEDLKKLLESVREKLWGKAAEIKAYGNAVIELLDENDQESCVSPEERLLRGEFTFEHGKLDFVCHTQNVEFEEVLAAITAMRDECQRQIDSQNKCPHFKG